MTSYLLSATTLRSFPADWLEVNDTSTYPLVHGQSVSPWFPELRSLLLGGNHINTTGYTALQTIVNWKSIQTLDLSENALTGSVEDALTLFYCHESGGAECGANISSVAAPMLRVLKLDGNTLTGKHYDDVVARPGAVYKRTAYYPLFVKGCVFVH